MIHFRMINDKNTNGRSSNHTDEFFSRVFSLFRSLFIQLKRNEAMKVTIMLNRFVGLADGTVTETTKTKKREIIDVRKKCIRYEKPNG